MSKIKVVQCTFCGNEIKKKDKKVFVGQANNDIRICEDCVLKCMNIMEQMITHTGEKDGEKAVLSEITPKKIKAKLDEWIIDQEYAKKKMSIAMYDHFKMINQDTSDKNNIIEKSNIMLVGSTGTGKTAILKALQKILDLPLCIEDVTTITTAGYQGRNIEDILSNLVIAANGDIEKAERGIVFLDEGDKLKKQSDGRSNRDVKGEGVQQGLLKMVEGGTYEIKVKGKPAKINTENILFVLGGAFEGIDKIISRRLNKKVKTTGGFATPLIRVDDNAYNEVITKIMPEDLKEYGMSSELTGRFPVIVSLQELSNEALIKILTEPKGAILKQVSKSFGMDNVEVEFDNDALVEIAKKAKERKTGARALRSLVEKTLEEAKYEVPGSDIKSIFVDKDLSTKFIKANNE